MPWTESRSRDEWLADVRGRGDRIRRRRRLAVALVGALALVLPVGVVATFLGDRAHHPVELSVGGPTGGEEAPTSSAPPTVVDGVTPTTIVSAAAAAAGPVGSAPPTTTTEAQRRVAGVNGFLAPTSPASIPATDDPVVRDAPSTTGPTSASSSNMPRTAGVSNAAGGQPSTPVSTDPPFDACPAAEVGVSVVTEKATYAPGETVRGTSTLESRSATACALPTRPFFRIEDGAGKLVGSFAYTAELRIPVKSEPGKTFTGAFTWDQKDCAASPCAQVAAGTYVAVADWTEAGPYSGRVSFQIGG